MFDGSRAGQPLLFKNEHAKIGQARQFIGLCPKVYSFAFHGSDSQKSTAKGIASHTAEKHLPHERYVEALEGVQMPDLVVAGFNSRHMATKFYESTRRGLNAFDCKRYQPVGSQHTLGHGHYRIPELQAATEKK